MKDFVDHPLYLLLLLPVGLTVVRSVFQKEILYWVGFLSAYVYRPYDLDGNPDTHDWCMLYNPGDGSWSYVSMTYRFGLFKSNTGVFVHRYRPDTFEHVMVQRLSFAEWASCGKAYLDPDAAPQALLGGPMSHVSPYHLRLLRRRGRYDGTSTSPSTTPLTSPLSSPGGSDASASPAGS
jgi:hypothetical protein